ncbi:MAG: hypothetical protein GF364_22770 [Candidatus Lokiarchaeota archaeon]|nr:hypothetical protein [Candidatus Lokiarchaeota archaeon]
MTRVTAKDASRMREALELMGFPVDFRDDAIALAIASGVTFDEFERGCAAICRQPMQIALSTELKAEIAGILAS